MYGSGVIMTHCETGGRVLAVSVHSPGATLDDVVLQCPDLTWTQIVLAIDRFSRNGEMPVIGKSPGDYTLSPSEPVRETHMARQLGKG